MTVPVNPAAAWLTRIWRALPGGPLTERELDERILEIDVPDPNGWRGDFAKASAMREGLVSCGAVTFDVDAEGRSVYRKATAFPQLPRDNGPGTEGFNAYLRSVSEAQEADFRRVDETRASEFVNSPAGIQREQTLALIRAEIQPLKVEIRELRDEIARLTQVAA